ncbi:MAG: UvrB/UvrC motif-containing protein [Candidatus Krumholzibacteriota bacterium]|nr:UvrB/UvrC motif-containing protein [Candidatus Krumholzibacteriota bacterium]
MLCQFCRKREATIHFTNVMGDTVEKIHLCRQCADEKGFDYLKKSNFTMEHLLSGLMSDAAGAAPAGMRDRCPNCGATLASIMKAGKIGCSACYEHFGEGLMPSLSHMHGNTRHRGKIPGRLGGPSRRRRLEDLRRELADAVAEERYERAAEIRDEIRSIGSTDEGGAD